MTADCPGEINIRFPLPRAAPAGEQNPKRKGAGPTKRLIAFTLALCLIVCLGACQAESTASSPDGSAQPSSGIEPNISPDIPSGPAPKINLITGAALGEGLQEGDRPVAILVSNTQNTLPQRGLASADAMFEMVAEGGVTRLMALYADKDAVPQTGPVRSARDQHLQFAMPMNSIIVHIGTSIYAENLLNHYRYATVNGMYLGSTSFWFDEARQNAGYGEAHCWFTDAGMIAAGMEKNQIPATGSSQQLFDFVPFDSAPVVPETGSAAEVSFRFSDISPVSLSYDASASRYLKTAFDAPQMDELTGTQLSFDNVLILFATVKLKNPDDANNLVMDFTLTNGTGYYCYGGKYRAVRWVKGNPEDALHILDEDGNILPVNVGKSYVAVVGTEWESTLTFDGVPVSGAPAEDSDGNSAADGSGEQ